MGELLWGSGIAGSDKQFKSHMTEMLIWHEVCYTDITIPVNYINYKV